LGIGYGRAARLIDFMSEDGIVGQYNGSQAREVAITVEQWETMRSGAEDAAEPAPSKAKNRSNKIRRDDSWEDTPKAPKASKKKKRTDDEEEAFVAATEADHSDEENQWTDDED
jgi:S-DNA-T family DNA segregation ATPase FtsK/SpoIIIE